MRTATWKRPLVFGTVAALALTATTPSFGQPIHQRQPATQRHSGGETSGQAPRSRVGDPSDQRSSDCWISSDDNDHGTYGYPGPCSDPHARPVK
jgi:hypothetical protein